ncbi:hypothetical protein H0H92_014280 [Tricholoma furcatifolium]|nr:hypothetical protein H0H92_014280 [Tricholoma furcatifolium]
MHFHFPAFSRSATVALVLLACASTSFSKRHCDKLEAGEYIVELGHGIDLSKFLRGKAFKQTEEFKFINAFAAHFSLAQISALCQDTSVAYITENAMLEPLGNTLSQNSQPLGPPPNEYPWNLHRLNLAHPIPIDETHQIKEVWNRGFTFQNEANAGENVDIYILDTANLKGVFVEHSEFEGRARHGWSYVEDKTDHSGHGTEVAGVAASSMYGVANKAQIISVKYSGDLKVVDGRAIIQPGKVNSLVAGAQYVLQQHKERKLGRHSVLNISQRTAVDKKKELVDITMSTQFEHIIDRVVRNLVRSDIHVIVGAGNTGSIEAQYRSPSRVEEVITVGASTFKDTRADFSDWGKAVDIFAPGERIWTTSAHGATPHVTGIVATILSSKGGLKIVPARMVNMVKAMAQRNSRVKLNLSGDHQTTDLLAHLDLEELRGM